MAALLASTICRAPPLASQAFSHTATYDTAIAEWMQGELGSGKTGVTTLKYGCNPQQKPASVRGLLSPQGPQPMPFEVLCGEHAT